MLNPYSFINIGVWNIHGLFLKINDIKLNKLDDPKVRKRIKTFNIFCLQETYLRNLGIGCTHFKGKLAKIIGTFGGSLLLIKNELREGVKIIESRNADKIWVKFLKSFFNFGNDLAIRKALIMT